MAGFALALVTITAGPAAAAAGPVPEPIPGPVSVPEHTLATSLRLIGASAGGVAVEQGTAQESWGVGTVLTGVEGSRLTARTFGEARHNMSLRLVGVGGSSLAWVTSQIPKYGYEAHRMHLRTGDDVLAGAIGEPLAVVGDHWLSTQAAGSSVTPITDARLFEDTPLNTDPPSLGGRDLGRLHGGRILAPGDGYVVEGWTDEDSAHHVDLISLADGSRRTIADPADPVVQVAVGAGQVAWLTQADPGTAMLHRRGLHGGEVSSSAVPGPDPASSVEPSLVSGDGGVAYLASADHHTFLRVADGDDVRSVEVPAGSRGLAAVGDRFLTAVGGDSRTAGVYAVAPDGRVTRTATVPAYGFPQTDPTLNAGRLYWADDSLAGTVGQTLWSRKMSGRSPVRLTAEKQFPVPMSGYAYSLTPQFAVSAGRSVLNDPSPPDRLSDSTRLFDGTAVTGRIEGWGGNVNLSGPFAAVQGIVYRPDGTVLYRPEDHLSIDSIDLFGSTLVYTRIDQGAFGSVGNSVWLDDARHPRPRRLRGPQAGVCSDQQQVAIWADTVAWVNCRSRVIVVKNLRTGAERKVPVGARSGATRINITLAEGMLGWVNGFYDGRVLDLTDPHAEPVRLPGRIDRISVDDGAVARETYDPDRKSRVDAQLLFPHRYRPRLFGTLAGPRIRSGAIWRPQFDATKPLRDVRLKITDPRGRTIQYLHGSDTGSGSVRDLRWDGRRRSGNRVPGTYVWTLTAIAADGDGVLVPSQRDGRATTGTVQVL
ncbi:hypothetical protein Kisp02_21270 [Kineosporia sp. NBRC 101731]|nr:hypothetical protein Kisp02_21270 [Kineosporia sp. NBRC 101731]